MQHQKPVRSSRLGVYRISIDALFVALYVILGTVLSFKIPGAIQISLSTLPILLVAFLLTPADAAAVALLGTFLEQILDPSPFGFSTLPIWLIPGVVYPVRLACVRHAASVRPEPGSNSQKVVSKPFPVQIKFLNNLLLAFITQEFSLAVIRSKTLKQSIYNCPRC